MSASGALSASSGASHQRLEIIRESTRKAQHGWRRVRRLDTSTLVISIITAVVVTLVTSISAINNDPRDLGFKGWQSLSYFAAALSAIGAIAAGLRQGLSTSDKLQKFTACVGKLQALEYGTSVGATSPEEVDKQYQEVIAKYPDCII